LYSYDSARLGTNLDRTENLYGLSGDYAVLPELKTVVEYRHQDVLYWSNGFDKTKASDFGLVGADYDIAKKFTASVRIGYEYRQRDGESNEGLPYAELSAKYDYAKGSYLTAGYLYTLQETSNVQLYTDEKVNRLFVNIQHSITALIVASTSIDYEPSQLQGVIGHPNVNETTAHLGAALSYLPTKNWLVSATYDYDNVSSGDPTRGLSRNRVGVSARYTF
jgi:opacity protein-like surface antigen